MSEIPGLQDSKTGTCPDLGTMFSLQPSANQPISSSGGLGDFLSVVDNFPTHNTLAPYEHGSYLNVYVKTHYPLGGATLRGHSVVLLNDFHYQQNLTFPANQTHCECFYYPLANFSLAYPGYVTINASGNVDVGVLYSRDYIFLNVVPVPAGDLTVLVGTTGSSGPRTENITVVYHYWTP